MEPLEHHLLGQADGPRISFWHRVRAQSVLDHVPTVGAVVADIGAGAGSLGSILQDQRPRATYSFFEPLDTLAVRLRADFGSAAERNGPDDLDGADIVAVLDVMEHIEDDRAFAASVVTAMPLGSVLVLTVPALPWLWSPWDVALGHHRRYTRASLRAVFSGLPLQTTEVSYLFPELLLPASVRRLQAGVAGRGEAAPGAADFPVFAPPLDAALHRISTVSYRARRWAPLGTSLLISGVRSRR